SILSTTLHRTPSGAVWYADMDGLHRFQNGRITRNLPLPSFPVRRLLEDSRGGVWMEIEQANQRRLARFEEEKLSIFSEKDGVPTGFRTVSFTEDREGTLWFGLQHGGGLLRFADGK